MAVRKIAPLERTRLLNVLMAAPRFAVIQAPAGFGKTMLLDQLQARLARSGRPAVRLNLAEEACDEAALLAALARLGETALLIDDAERLRAFPTAAKRLAAASAGARVVLAGRGDSGVPLARHRAAGEVLDLGPEQLLFDEEEQQAVLADWDRPPATASLAGWPCGFGLQFGQLPNGALNGSWRVVADYFEQEIGAELPAELARFLRETSVLEQLTVEDCDMLAGDGRSAALLTEAHALGAPLWPVDPEHRRYAILPLFREVLRRQLGVAEAARLAALAADRFEARGRFRDACVQALAFGDHALAARLLEHQFVADFAVRDNNELLVLVEQLPRGERDRHPFILLALAQALTFRFEFEKVRRLLDQVRVLADAFAARPEADAGETRTLEMLLLHREMVLALGQHELSKAQEYGDRLLRDIEAVPPMQRVMILNSLTYAQQELYIFRGAERYYVQAKKLIPELDSWISSVPLETFYAQYLFQTGRTGAAIALLEATLARLVEELGPRPVLGSIAAIVLAEMKFETNELAEAAQLLADYGANVEEFGFLPMTLAARIVQARLHMASGEPDLGFAILEKPLVGAGELFERLSRALAIERIYWLFRLGRVEAAKAACGAIGLSLTRPPQPHSSAAALEESFATAWIQLARAHKRIDDAIHLAQKWQRYTEGVGAVRSNVRWNVILASLQVLAEEPGQAMRHLRRAVPQGAGGLYRAAFLAEADVLRDQLALLVRSDLNEAESAFLASVADGEDAATHAAEPAEISVPLGAFSSREGAILRLVAKGMLNREIGEALGMTEGTVKWYLQRIYDKLGVRRRSQVALMVSQWHARPHKEVAAVH